jgi:hypothetical protein
VNGVAVQYNPKEDLMSIHVLVEPLPDNAGYRGSTGSPLNLSATAKTPEEVLDDIGRQLAEKWDRGARIYPIPGLPTTRRRDVSLPPKELEKLESAYRAAIEEYRDQCDTEERHRLGISDSPPAA